MKGSKGFLQEGDTRRSVEAGRPGCCLVLLILEGSTRLEIAGSQRQRCIEKSDRATDSTDLPIAG